MATKLTETDFIYDEIKRKKKYAREKMKLIKNSKSVLDEVLFQIEVCEELHIPLQEEQIDKWLYCRSERQVACKATAWKLAELRKE